MNGDLLIVVSEIGEAILDQSFDDGVFRDIPVLGSLVGLIKVARSIPERILAVKIGRFVKVLSEATPKDREKFSSKLDGDPDRRRMVGEIVLLSIEQLDRVEKSELLAIVFLAYVRDEITDLEYRRMNSGIVRADMDILEEFFDIVDADPNHSPRHLQSKFEQLISCGFAVASGMMSPKGNGTLTLPSELGLKLFSVWKYSGRK